MTAEELQQQDEDDLAWALSQPQGRRFVRRIIERWSRLEAASFTGEKLSAEFNEGQRSVGRALKSEARRLQFGLYKRMMIEGLDEEEYLRATAPRPSVE